MSRNQLLDTALHVYKNAVYNKHYDNELRLVEQNIGAYLKISRKTIGHHIRELVNEGVLHFVRYTNENQDGQKVSKFRFSIYETDTSEFASWLSDHGVEVPTKRECMAETTEYCNFCLQASKARKANPGKSEKEIGDVAKEKLTHKRDVELERLKKALTKHDKIFSVKSETDFLNDYYGGLYITRYLNELKKRYVTNVCPTPNPEKSEDQTRIEFVKGLIHAEEIAHWDKSASTYALSLAFGTREIPDINEDTYRRVLDASCLLRGPITDESWQMIRPSIKALFMPTTMKESSIYFRTVTQRKGFYIKKTRSWSGYYTKGDKQFKTTTTLYNEGLLKGKALETYEQELLLEKFFNRDLYVIVKMLADAMHKVFKLDKFFGKNIFLWESDLYILVQYTLLTQYGIETVAVYDCFYYDAKHTNFAEIFEKVYRECLQRMLDNPAIEKEISKYRQSESEKVSKTRKSQRKKQTFLLPALQTLTTDEITNIYEKADELEKQGVQMYF